MKSFGILLLASGIINATPILCTFSGHTGGSRPDMSEHHSTSPAQGSGPSWSEGILTVEKSGMDNTGDGQSKICIKPGMWNEMSIFSPDKYIGAWKIGHFVTLAGWEQKPFFSEETTPSVADPVLVDASPVAVPEPSSLALFVLGGGLLAWGVNKRSKKTRESLR